MDDIQFKVDPGTGVEKCKQQNASKCPHHMHGRCPKCKIEMYVPTVFAFSHGEVSCQCGFIVIPTLHGVRA